MLFPSQAKMPSKKPSTASKTNSSTTKLATAEVTPRLSSCLIVGETDEPIEMHHRSDGFASGGRASQGEVRPAGEDPARRLSDAPCRHVRPMPYAPRRERPA